MDKEKEELSALRTDISVGLNDKESERKKYEEAEKNALKSLEFFGIGETELFDREAVLLNIETSEREMSEKISEYRWSLRRQEQYLEAVKSGTVHTSPEISTELKKRNIDFTTGE